MMLCNGTLLTENLDYSLRIPQQSVLAEKNDTAQLRIRFQMGAKAQIKRPGYWDTLQTEAGRCNAPLYACRSLARMVALYAETGEVEKAQQKLDEGISIAEENNYRMDLLHLLHVQTRIVVNRMDRRILLDRAYKGLCLAEELKDKPAMADFYSKIGVNYFFVGEIKEALKMHFLCLRLYRELNDPVGIAGTLTDIGSDYKELNQMNKTLYYYLEGAKYSGEMKGTYCGAYLDNTLASAYVELQQADSAYKYANRAYAVFDQLKNEGMKASALIVMARALFQKGEVDQAERLAEKSLRLARAVGFIMHIPHNALVLKSIYLHKKDYQKALAIYELYVTMRDSISNDRTRKLALQKEFDYIFGKKENEYKLLQQQSRIRAYILIGVIILSLLIIGYIFLLLNQKRTRLQQKSGELEQKLLRSQMNPHFIFNSLNSVQQFIMGVQNDKAELYLSKFAKLMREMLESSERAYISVGEEVRILQGYLEMEALRFGNSFSFTIGVNERINQDATLIPQMLIQPIVENAIWHGLLPKEGDRHLVIDFEKGPDKHTITCVIEDNGVGCENSAKKQSFKKKSFGLQLVSQRISLLSKNLAAKGSVEIIDKKENGTGNGTKVIVILPLFKK